MGCEEVYEDLLNAFKVYKPGVVAPNYNPQNWEAEVIGLLESQGSAIVQNYTIQKQGEKEEDTGKRRE